MNRRTVRSRSRSGLPELFSTIASRKRWLWPIIPMLHHFPRNFPCNQRRSLVSLNPLSLVTQRFFLYSGQSLLQDPDRNHQERLMEYHNHLSGRLKALIQGRGFRQLRQPRMSQLGTTGCLAIVWLLQSQSGVLSLCSLLHLSHLQVSAHSNFLLC